MSSRCTCDSVVRAPIAPHEIKSAVYCGLIASRNSVPAGRPILATSNKNPRARRSPLLIWNEPSRLGSLIKPFQPTVVRGFSKYTRMTICKSSLAFSAYSRRRCAYSSPARTSCKEHGPTTTTRRSCSFLRIASISRRPFSTVSAAFIDNGYSSMRICGGMSGLMLLMWQSSSSFKASFHNMGVCMCVCEYAGA